MLQTGLETFWQFLLPPYESDMFLNTFHDGVILRLLEKNLKTQVEKHELKNVLLILIIETLKLEIVFIKLSV